MPPSEGLEIAKTVATGYGAFQIWSRIVSGSIAIVVLSVAAVLISRYHKGWKEVQATVLPGTTCAEQSTSTTDPDSNRTTTSTNYPCTIPVSFSDNNNDVSVKVTKSFLSDVSASMPKTLAVTYDPSDASGTATASFMTLPSQRLFIGVLIALILLVAGGVVVAFSFRNNKSVQLGVGTIAGVSGIAGAIRGGR